MTSRSSASTIPRRAARPSPSSARPPAARAISRSPGSTTRRPKPATGSIACSTTARCELLATLPAGATSFSETVANYSSYSYAVQAIDAAGNARRPQFTAPFQAGSTFADRTNHARLPRHRRAQPRPVRRRPAPHRAHRLLVWRGPPAARRHRDRPQLHHHRAGGRQRRTRTPASRCGRAWMPSCAGTAPSRSRSRTATSGLHHQRPLQQSATPNQRFMLCAASYLANGVWGDAVNSVSSASYGTSDPTGKAPSSTSSTTPFRGYEEHNSNHYLLYTLGPWTLAQFAPDAEVQEQGAHGRRLGDGRSRLRHAKRPLGRSVTRGRVAATQEGYSNTGFAWWLLFGGPLPGDMLDSSNATVLASPTFPGLLPEFTRAATERTQSYTRRTFAQRSAGPQLAYFKQAWMTPNYALEPGRGHRQRLQSPTAASSSPTSTPPPSRTAIKASAGRSLGTRRRGRFAAHHHHAHHLQRHHRRHLDLRGHAPARGHDDRRL